MQTTSSIGRAFTQKQEWIARSPRCGWNAAKQLYFPYADYKGFKTEACGHLVTGSEDFSAGLTETQADELFAHDLAKYEAAVTKTFGDIPQNCFDAWVDFCFNEGTHSVDPARNSAVRAFLAGDIPTATQLLLAWDVTAGVHDPGLHARRAAEGYVMLHPYPDDVDHQAYFAPVADHMSTALEASLGPDLAQSVWDAEDEDRKLANS